MKHTRWELDNYSREILGEPALVEMFDPTVKLDRRNLLEVLHLVAKESEVPVGQLRPFDKFEDIFKRLPIYNPLRWWYLENKIAAKQENLEFAVWDRRKKLGFPKNTETIITVNDYVMLWCMK